jgi:hypothetical protein
MINIESSMMKEAQTPKILVTKSERALLSIDEMSPFFSKSEFEMMETDLACFLL